MRSSIVCYLLLPCVSVSSYVVNPTLVPDMCSLDRQCTCCEATCGACTAESVWKRWLCTFSNVYLQDGLATAYVKGKQHLCQCPLPASLRGRPLIPIQYNWRVTVVASGALKLFNQQHYVMRWWQDTQLKQQQCTIASHCVRLITKAPNLFSTESRHVLHVCTLMSCQDE